MTVQTTGQCHCGSVKFSIELPDGISKPVRCNCSMCRMKGAVMVFAHVGGLEITEGQTLLSTYEFHSKIAKHHFCSKCGIHLLHQRRFDPAQYGVNVAVLDGVSPFDFAEVPVMDGNDHPKDRGGDSMAIAGIMRYNQN